MVLGFITAGYLINQSYAGWLESPILTTITTKPISDLDFPTVTVCPPRDSYTALNYDLMKADNKSLTEQDRLDLKNEVFNIMIKQPHQNYVKLMLAATNPPNIINTFRGFHSVPKPMGERGFEINMWNKNGSVQTPWLGQHIREDF